MRCATFVLHFAGVALLALSCVSGAAPLAPLAPLASDYTHTAWGTLQGAPAKVLRIAQSTDGWLWLASESGLYRYDGVQFERVQQVYGQPLASSGIFRVMADRDGAVWVCYYLGGMTMFRKDGARSFGPREGLPAGEQVFDVKIGPDKALWVATRAGALRMAPDAGRFERQGSEAGLDGSAATRILFTRDGTQWILTASGAFVRRIGEPRFVLASPKLFTNIAEAPDGTVWALTDNDQYWHLRAVPANEQPASRPELSAIALGFDRDGFMWVLNRHDVERRRAATDPASAEQRLTRGDGLSGKFPQPFFQDREGNIWIATFEGLDRFRRNRLHAAKIDEEFMFPGVFRKPDGQMLITNSDGGLHRVDAAGNSERISQDRFTASDRPGDGTFLLAGIPGVRRESPDGTVTVQAPPEGTRGKEPNAVIQDRDGGVWLSLSGNGGLFRLASGRWLGNGGLDGFPNTPVYSMARDGNGTIWMGHAGNTISLVSGASGRSTVRSLDSTKGLQVGNVLSLLPDGNTIWVGGERGVMLFRGGRLDALRGVQGESFRGVAGMARTGEGDLWLHGVDGLYRIGAAQLAAWMRDPTLAVAFERFDAQDGLRGQAPQLRPLPSLLADAEGRLWAATGTSVVVVDPQHIYRNPLAPPVVMRAVATRDKSYDVEGRASLTLPKGTDSLRLTFTGLSLSIPERVRFRYRLVGVDADWNTPMERRAATYTNLAPGMYSFQVSAANEDGVWRQDPVALQLDIPPTFVQTKWFTMLLALAGALLLYLVYRLRVRVISARLQERHLAQLEERARIARSLHDTLLQSVQGVMLSFSAHVNHVRAGSEERASLDQTLRFARTLIVEARDQITGLRTSTSDDLGLALQAYGEELSRLGRHAFEMRTTGEVRMLLPDVRDELHAIGREAIFNATHHAHAGKVVLEIDYGPASFTLRVRDDGRGVAPAVLDAGERPGHWGLRSMRERALAMRASYRLVSRPGDGTDIVVTLPGRRAYVAPPAGRRALAWFGRFLDRMQRR